jgi:hypothetical protein
MAVLLGGTLAEKKQLIDDLTCAYKVRSAFIHHGEDVRSEREPLNRVLAASREVVRLCLGSESFATKENLIRDLDDKLLA